MKKLLLLLFIAPALLFSCDKIDEANTVDFDTTVSMEIPVSVAAPTAIVQKSAEADHPFSESKTYSLSSNADIKDYLNKLQSIDIEDFAIMFTGLGEGEVINKLDISVPDVGILVTFTNVSNADTSPTPSAIFYPIIQQAGNKLNATKSLTIMVSGTTNTAPMDFSVNMDFDLHVEAKAL